MVPSVSVLTVFDCVSKFASGLYYCGESRKAGEGAALERSTSSRFATP